MVLGFHGLMVQFRFLALWKKITLVVGHELRDKMIRGVIRKVGVTPDAK